MLWLLGRDKALFAWSDGIVPFYFEMKDQNKWILDFAREYIQTASNPITLFLMLKRALYYHLSFNFGFSWHKICLLGLPEIL
jgi:ABC-type multidrug transport system permease subunit